MIDWPKKQRLQAYIDHLAQNDCLLAFSGGTDSALVLALLALATQRQGTRLFAVYIRTALMPSKDETIAQGLADKFGVPYEVLCVNEWDDPAIIRNGPDRCYHCKRKLFTALGEKASRLGIEQVIDGTNHDDLQSYRPGLQAIKELNVISPLAHCGITKVEVRTYLNEFGLAVAKRPSSPCLATRIPYGTPLDLRTLQRIEQAEQYLIALGCYNVRVRLHGDIARIEVDEADMLIVMQARSRIVEYFKNLGFIYISLDLAGFRSGSLDAKIQRH